MTNVQIFANAHKGVSKAEWIEAFMIEFGSDEVWAELKFNQLCSNKMQILENLKQQLDDAPKSSAGFVNWKRSSRLQREAVAAMIEQGEDMQNAKQEAWKVAKPYDTHYSKIA